MTPQAPCLDPALTELIADAMTHPQAGLRLLTSIVLTHASVNGEDPAWDPEFAVNEARIALEHDDPNNHEIRVSATASGQVYRIDPGSRFPAARMPLIPRLIDIALLEAPAMRIQILTQLVAALQEHGDIDAVVNKTDDWFTLAAAREALASMVAMVAADERIDRRFWNIVGLTNALAIQSNHHGVWIAVDMAREFLFDSQPDRMGVPFARNAEGRIVDILTQDEFPDHDLVALSRVIALTEDPLARQAALANALLSLLPD